MKKPKSTKRYCPFCNKKTEHKITLGKTSGRDSAHPQSRYAASRVKKRGQRRGYGNLGRFSKPAIKNWKRKTKSTKKAVLVYTCQTCKKAHQCKTAKRSSKIMIE